jgi:N-ethylmaleimide reductase
MSNGGYSYETGCKTVEIDNADLIVYGALYVMNPDLVERF